MEPQRDINADPVSGPGGSPDVHGNEGAVGPAGWLGVAEGWGLKGVGLRF